MERIKPRTLSGFMELLPGPQMQMERIMEIIPFAIIGYLGITSPGFLDILYHNITGAAVMTVCLCIYIVGFVFAERIMKIEV